jgi:hypothetical protein
MGNALKRQCSKGKDSDSCRGGLLSSYVGVQPHDLTYVGDNYTFKIVGKDMYIRVINMDAKKHAKIASYFDVVEKKKGPVYKLKPFYTFSGLHHISPFMGVTDTIIVRIQKFTSNYLIKEREWGFEKGYKDNSFIHFSNDSSLYVP